MSDEESKDKKELEDIAFTLEGEEDTGLSEAELETFEDWDSEGSNSPDQPDGVAEKEKLESVEDENLQQVQDIDPIEDEDLYKTESGYFDDELQTIDEIETDPNDTPDLREPEGKTDYRKELRSGLSVAQIAGPLLLVVIGVLGGVYVYLNPALVDSVSSRAQSLIGGQNDVTSPLENKVVENFEPVVSPISETGAGDFSDARAQGNLPPQPTAQINEPDPVAFPVTEIEDASPPAMDNHNVASLETEADFIDSLETNAVSKTQEEAIEDNAQSFDSSSDELEEEKISIEIVNTDSNTPSAASDTEQQVRDENLDAVLRQAETDTAAELQSFVNQVNEIEKAVESSETPMEALQQMTGEPSSGEQQSGQVIEGAANGTSSQEDLYFDAGSAPQLSSPGIRNDPGPRKVDPRRERAQKLIVVEGVSSADSLDSQIVAADRALRLGRYDAALEMFENLYTKNKRDQRILLGRAIALQNAGRSEAAIQAYEELLDIDEDNMSALVNLLGLLRKQYPQVALRKLRDLNKEYPHHAGITAQLGVTEAAVGNYPDAIRFLQMAVSIAPRNAIHFYNLAVVLDQAGYSEEAIRHYEEALEVNSVYGGKELPRKQIYDRLSRLRN